MRTDDQRSLNQIKCSMPQKGRGHTKATFRAITHSATYLTSLMSVHEEEECTRTEQSTKLKGVANKLEEDTTESDDIES